MKKFISFILFLAVIIIVTFIIARNTIVKEAAERGVVAVTGFPLKIASIDIDLKNSLIDIDDLVLHNPDQFEEDTMLSIPDIYVNYDIGAIVKGIVHMEEIRLDMKEFIVVKNKDGEVNITTLKKAVEPKESKKKPKGQPKKTKKANLVIDLLSLKIIQKEHL
jgi:uncharacterized protein involved in outer membrane biogenesis